MTCEQLRTYVEETFRDSNFGTDRPDVLEHISACAECARFVDDHGSLVRTLTFLKESAGQVPETLDAAVLAKYRQFAAGQQVRSTRLSLPAVQAWAWGATAAIVIVVITVWLSASRHTATTAKISEPTPAGKALASQQELQKPVTPAPAKNVSTNSTVRRHAVPASKEIKAEVARPSTQVPVRMARSLPEGFRSLMYCDALSCPEAMDVIRIQLPASAMRRALPGLVQTSGSVTADVLVGADGIARGIRYEEIEF